MSARCDCLRYFIIIIWFFLLLFITCLTLQTNKIAFFGQILSINCEKLLLSFEQAVNTVWLSSTGRKWSERCNETPYKEKQCVPYPVVLNEIKTNKSKYPLDFTQHDLSTSHIWWKEVAFELLSQVSLCDILIWPPYIQSGFEIRFVSFRFCKVPWN